MAKPSSTSDPPRPSPTSGVKSFEAPARLVRERPPDVRHDRAEGEQPAQHQQQGDRALDPLLGLGAADREPGRVVDDLHAVAPGALTDQVEPGQRRVLEVERVTRSRGLR